jgi:alpha-tubulin suppressor-like RCC1 family protein
MKKTSIIVAILLLVGVTLYLTRDTLQNPIQQNTDGPSEPQTETVSNAGYIDIKTTNGAFAALKEDGTITAWGDKEAGGSGAPTDDGYVAIYANNYAFAALKEDGSITAWGRLDNGGAGAPTDSGYTTIYPAGSAFAAKNKDGSITAWGSASSGGISPFK